MAPPSGSGARPGRMLAVLAALIVVLFLAIVGSDLGSPASWHKDFRVLLGLDLTSGTTVSLQAVTPKGAPPVKQSEMKTARQIMENRVNGAGFTEAQVEQQGSDIINVSVPGGNPQKVVSLVSTTAELLFRQVLLVAPNSAAAVPAPSPSAPASPSPSAPASPSPSGSASPSPSAPASASPSASTKAKVSPSVSPGAAAGTPALAAAPSGQPQEMAQTSHPLAAASASPSSSASPSPSATASAAPASGTTSWQQASGDASRVSAQVKALFNKLNCTAKGGWKQSVGYSSVQYNKASVQTVSCGKVNGVWYKYALDKAKVLGTMITSASATLDPTNNQWQVDAKFNGKGTTQFGKLTAQQYAAYHGSPSNPLNQIAFVLDGTVVSAPYTADSIPGGSTTISGNFTQASATTLANQLSYGALPLSFHKLSIQSTTPQLGHDQLAAGLLAAALGLILVVVYLLIYYRGLALIAASSLVIAGVLAYMSVVVLGKYASLALNLAGVAGLIVAIGITADSFVVYFERLRDEVRDGRSLRAAVERGWGRARRTILVSDTVSFIAAALLYYFAIGSVKGFAFTLGLTTIIDVVVVFTFTKPMITLLARTKFYGGGHALSGLDPARLGARAPWRGSRRAPSASPARTSSSARPSGARTSPAKEA